MKSRVRDSSCRCVSASLIIRRRILRNDVYVDRLQRHQRILGAKYVYAVGGSAFQRRLALFEGSDKCKWTSARVEGGIERSSNGIERREKEWQLIAGVYKGAPDSSTRP